MSADWLIPQQVKLVNLGKVYQQGLVMINQNNEKGVVFNFQKLTRYDSSIVALLLAWMKHAKQQNCSLGFKELQASIKHIAELSDTADLIASYEV